MTTPTTQPEIRDLIYFDLKKVSSLLSQLEGGLVTSTQASAEVRTEERQTLALNLQLLRGEFGSLGVDKASLIEERVLHHGMLQRLERLLVDSGVLAVVDPELVQFQGDKVDAARSTMSRHSFSRVSGFAIFQDYTSLVVLLDRFSGLVGFMNKIALQAAESTEEVTAARRAIETMKNEIKTQGTAQRTAGRQRIKDLETSVEQAIASVSTMDAFPDWLLQGFKLFFESFIGGRLEVRVQPILAQPEFEIIANLKRDCFVDADIGNVIYAYGTRPDVPLTVLGFVTSVPSDPLDEQAPVLATRRADTNDDFAAAVDKMFSAVEEMQRQVTMTKFPSVTVYPLAVYQRLAHGHGGST